ncbi:agmatine deiminase family protein [Nonomuraea turcica]|uniref:agmatine deiminase family protein n=1 Tax=Nonomuraea sp. G32 TaxID=3067274 RepID=UPI00273B8C1D|nr:agmatine deiminase family protein [Nonomuraea sp. G32]MDP4501759.1 agmatine deiminase family protein [Nonomuraea sp. G32]
MSEPMRWRMPAETAPHECTWMAFPPASPALGGNADDIDIARRTWTQVAHTILEFEPVIMVVDPSDVADARTRLSREVTIVEQPLDDAWMRDIGLTFVLDADGRLGGVDWSFNGWGGQEWASWDLDSKVAAAMADVAGCAYLPSAMVNEGGGIHVDGLGTVLVTETVQLDPGRNPGMSKDDVERELAATIGAEQAIWLRRGLTRDYEVYGTRGHVDIVAAFPSPGTVLVHDQRDPEHPDHAVTAEVVDTLARTTDVLGRSYRIVRLPAPATLRDRRGFVDFSYVNHLVVNGGVVACTFDDPADPEALDVLAEVYPGRTVVGVDSREIFARGGGVHCITQQQPARSA